MTKKIYTVAHLFCGIGGGALGFQRARSEFKGVGGRFRTLYGVDFDAAACRDFEKLTGAHAACADINTMTPEELLAAGNGEHPDVMFLSPPCTGFSGLLSEEKSQTAHYQALNALVFKGIFLALETYRKKLPKLIVLENVPRIQQRGADLLRKVRDLLSRYGYRFHESTHDCGEVGGLAQHRRRFLMVARHEATCPTFLYHPPKKRVRAIGEVLEQMPLPDDPRGGAMHTTPKLKWKTWVRLALIPAGGDWRAIGTKSGATPFNNQLRIVPWSEPSIAVTGGGTPTSGGACVADPRFDRPGEHHNKYRVEDWSKPASTVTGSDRLGSGAPSVADPRFPAGEGYRRGTYRVVRWDEPSGTITGELMPSTGPGSVADPRIGGKGSRPDLFGVLAWSQPAKTVSGSASVSGSNCPAAVADPRVPERERIETAHKIPDDDDRPEIPPVIVALDGTWHRPLTTLELAALQGLPVIGEDGAPLVLDGRSQSEWRKRIGNMVPVGAGEAIGSEMLRTLLSVDAGATFTLGGSGVWVRREREAQRQEREAALQ